MVKAGACLLSLLNYANRGVASHQILSAQRVDGRLYATQSGLLDKSLKWAQLMVGNWKIAICEAFADVALDERVERNLSLSYLIDFRWGEIREDNK